MLEFLAKYLYLVLIIIAFFMMLYFLGGEDIVYFRKKKYNYDIKGEEKLIKALNRFAKIRSFTVLGKTTIAYGEKEYTFDGILLCYFGTIAFSVDGHGGEIYGSDGEEKWTKTAREDNTFKRNQADPQKTILSLQTTLAETAAHLKRHQECHRMYQQAQQTHLQLGQLVVNREALAKARHKDARLAGLSLLDGLSPGIELKHGNRLYRLRFEKINDQTMTKDQIPILSFRTAAVQTPHQERPMTQKDLDTIKKPLIAAIRGGQAAGVLPETVQEVPLIGKALKFDFLLGSLINKVFDASLPYQAVFNTTSALRQTNMTDFKPVVFRGDAQIEQPDEWVGFSFRVGSTTFKASIPYGCTITQNGTKRTMNAAEAAFFKKTAMLHMTPEQRAQSTVFGNYFNTYVLPEPQKSVALLTQHKAHVL